MGDVVMNLRKINAIISMLIVVLLLDHAIFYAVVMLSRYRIPAHATVLPWVITALVLIHAVLSIAMAILGHKGAEKRKCNTDCPKVAPDKYGQTYQQCDKRSNSSY